MKRALPAVAIVGRPNVGKSTLFNRVLGERRAVVEQEPGVTRDRNIARTQWDGRPFYIVDTGGLEPGAAEPMAAEVERQVRAAIAEADVLAFVVDGQAGVQPLDERIADVIRRAGRPVAVVVNKMDRLPEELGHHDFWGLALGEPLPVSALSGKGSGDVLDAIVRELPEPSEAAAEEALHVAVVGKPNVGKSSLVNRLLGEERVVVAESAGTTRDSIDTRLEYGGRALVLVDTAGLRRRSRIEPGLEYYSTLRTRRAVERADVCLLLIDATERVHAQDLKIAESVWDAGAGLAIVANKWDLVDKSGDTAAAYERYVRARAPWLGPVPVLFASARTGKRVQRALDIALEVAAQRSRRIPTSEVNGVLRELVDRHQPPQYRGRAVKLLYATQAEKAPPTFVLFTNEPNGVRDNYMRYLRNGFRERWGFAGVPLRLRLRRSGEGGR